MNSLYDMDEPLPSQEERNAAMEAAIQEAERIWRGRKKWALYLTAAVIVVLAAAVPFQKGFPLENFRLFDILMVLLEILFVPWVVCVAMWLNAWQLVSNVKRKAMEVKEEGY